MWTDLGELMYFTGMGLSTYEVLQIYAEVSPQLRGNFKHILDKIPESDFESFAQYLSIPEGNYKLLLTFLANNWQTLGTRSKEEILYDLKEPLKTYLSQNDQHSLKKLTLKTLNEYKGIKKEVGTGATGWQVIEITDPETCVRLTEGSGWCVKEHEFAERYLEDGPLYLIIRNGKRFALLHFETDSYMDPYDDPLLMKDLVEIKNNLPEFVESHPRFRYHYSIKLRDHVHHRLMLAIEQEDTNAIQQLSTSASSEINISWIIDGRDLLRLYRDRRGIKPEIIKFLIEQELVEPNPLPGMTPFLEMERGDVIKGMIQAVMAAGVDLNSPAEKHGTFLFAAAARGATYIVDVLLHIVGADPNVRNPGSQNTPLHGAALKGGDTGLHIAKSLIEKGVNINAVNANGMTPLDYAKSPAVAEFLKSNGGVSGDELKSR